MSNFCHRIRRLHCLVSTRSQADAFAIRQSLHDRWQDTLLPAFESTFDEIAGSDRVIHIPKLELHLKVTSEQELLDVLPELIQQQLNEQLQSIDLPSISTTPTQSSEVWRETTAQQNQFEILKHYLQTGSLPWQVSYASASEIAVDLKETCHQQRSQLINHLSTRAETTDFYVRLLQLLTRSEALAIIDPLLDRLSAEWKITIIEVIGFVSESTQIQLNQPRRSQLVAAILSRVSSEQMPSNEFSRSLDRILTQVGIDRQVLVNALPSVAATLFQTQPNFEPPRPNPNLPAVENPEINFSNYEALRSPLSNEFNLDSTNLLEKDLANQDREFETDFSDDVVNPVVDFTEQNDGFALFVNYAGLVLIHPFISPLFEATGIKETNSHTIADAQIPRAAALLHFLATGQEEIYEYELGLIKILLGLEPETPLLVGAGLIQDSDREEAETLLQSAISYWTVLGNTSTDGIRSSFLQRSGLLRRTEDSWSLNVEHQSFDMLLEHLPWTISIVKLSWMKYPLYTEWQTF